MKKVILTEILFLKKKALEKKLNCTFIRINISKEIMMQTMKLVEYKRLLVILIKTR